MTRRPYRVIVPVEWKLTTATTVTVAVETMEKSGVTGHIGDGKDGPGKRQMCRPGISSKNISKVPRSTSEPGDEHWCSQAHGWRQWVWFPRSWLRGDHINTQVKSVTGSYRCESGPHRKGEGGWRLISATSALLFSWNMGTEEMTRRRATKATKDWTQLWQTRHSKARMEEKDQQVRWQERHRRELGTRDNLGVNRRALRYWEPRRQSLFIFIHDNLRELNSSRQLSHQIKNPDKHKQELWRRRLKPRRFLTPSSGISTHPAA